MKRLFVTGGASGLGRAIALKYATEGFDVCIADVNDARGQETLTQLQTFGQDALYLHCDVRQLADLESAQTTLQQRWDGVDIVVNNAGVGGASGAIDEVTAADWDWVLDINLNGVMRGIRAFTPLFKRQKSGYFVNVASAAGLFNPPGMSAYSVAKAGVIALSESMRAELAAHHIDTTVVCPAFFSTNLLENMKFSAPGVHDRVTRWMEKSEISADDIAEQIFNAVNNRQFMLQPHPSVQQQWQLKCADPEAFATFMQDEGRKLLSENNQ